MPVNKPNLYALLGLFRSATADEVRRAYLKAAKKLHPDKNQAPGETELFLDVQQAYQVLSDPQRRASYDATLAPDAVDGKVEYALDCQIELSRPAIAAGTDKQLVYALLTLSMPARYQRDLKSPPLNICLALDCSTSMQGPKIQTAKASAVKLLHRLEPNDIFSVVRFSDRAEVAIPATRQIDKRRSEMQINLLQTGGGTEIFNGLQVAFEEVQRYLDPQYVNHIILLTDGRTYGDEPQCYALAKKAAEAGIGISGIGLGSGWNDIFLDELANMTGAGTVFAQQPEDIERFMDQRFAHLTHAFAQGVDLHSQLAPGVAIDYAFRIQPDSGALSFGETTRLGTVLPEEPLKVIFEIGIQSERQVSESYRLITGRLEAAIASILTPLADIPFNINVRVQDERQASAPPMSILQALSKLNLYRLQEKARVALDAGDHEKATRHLQYLATHLLAQGEKSLARTILFEAENIEQKNTFTEAGEKQIKYGTRSLLMPGERLL